MYILFIKYKMELYKIKIELWCYTKFPRECKENRMVALEISYSNSKYSHFDFVKKKTINFLFQCA